MIPVADRQRYQEFWSQVGRVQAAIAGSSDPDPSPPASILGMDLKRAIAELRQVFQTEILAGAGAEEPGMAQRLRSLHVEMDKQLQLLAMDVLFLQTARQAATVSQRRGQMVQRLELIGRYCAGVLGDGAGDRA